MLVNFCDGLRGDVLSDVLVGFFVADGFLFADAFGWG